MRTQFNLRGASVPENTLLHQRVTLFFYQKTKYGSIRKSRKFSRNFSVYYHRNMPKVAKDTIVKVLTVMAQVKPLKYQERVEFERAGHRNPNQTF